MKIRRVWRYVLPAAAAVYAAWLGSQAASYERYVSAPAATAGSPEPPSAAELRGAYHIHSRHSDGRKTADWIVRTASRAGLDFIILTDHGSPNRASLAAEGWKDGLLVLAGSELSSSRGHLVALAFDPPARPFSQNAAMAAREIDLLGGFTIIAHPYSKTRWSWGETSAHDGLEIMDSDSMARRNWPRVAARLPLLLVKPQAVLLKALTRPEEQIRMWDRMLESGPALGFYSVDAHFLYRPAFGLLRLHVLLDRPLAGEFAEARAQVFAALRDGRFFNAVDAAADPAGFRFWLDADGALRLRAPFSFAHEIRLIRDGRPAAEPVEKALALPAAEPGTYRAEVYLRERTPLGRDVPWIMSNSLIVPGR